MNIPDSIQLFIIVILLVALVIILNPNNKQKEPCGFTFYVWKEGATQNEEKGNWKSTRNSKDEQKWYYYDGKNWINATKEYNDYKPTKERKEQK